VAFEDKGLEEVERFESREGESGGEGMREVGLEKGRDLGEERCGEMGVDCEEVDQGQGMV
jgi:hypothetical protein